MGQGLQGADVDALRRLAADQVVALVTLRRALS